MAIPFRYNWRNLFARKLSTAATVLGIALVVAVFVAVLALAEGMEYAFRGSGSENNLLLLRQGAQSETQSSVSREQAAILRSLPGLARGADGEPAFATESIVLINQPRLDGKKANVIVRGTSPAGIALREGVRLVEGRWFGRGQGEIVTSTRMAKRFEGCSLGARMKFGGREWTVVGQFEAGGSAYDSEIWTDVEDLLAAFRREAFSSALLRPASPADAASVSAAVGSDNRLNFKAQTELAYYAEQSKQGGPLRAMGIFIATIMAIGAAFGAANTMYAAVAARTREIGTLRAIGFSRFAILAGFLLESVLLAAVGGVIGGILAFWKVNGLTTGTANWVTFSEVAFAFRVTPVLLAKGIAFAMAIGAIGGLLPAFAGARKAIVESLRES